jgi:predicted acetyltransferase
VSKKEIIDLKKESGFIDQYVHLRNAYTELLLTSPVTPAETKVWLKRDDIEVRGLVHGNILLGAVILYLSRNGEIAFFVKNKNKGFGSTLLDIIENVAKEKRLKSLWAWVLKDNITAQRVFDKNGFLQENIKTRVFKGIIRQGIEYKKYLHSDQGNNKC